MSLHSYLPSQARSFSRPLQSHPELGICLLSQDDEVVHGKVSRPRVLPWLKPQERASKEGKTIESSLKRDVQCQRGVDGLIAPQNVGNLLDVTLLDQNPVLEDDEDLQVMYGLLTYVRLAETQSRTLISPSLSMSFIRIYLFFAELLCS